MVTAEELRHVSDLASQLLGEIMEANCVNDAYLRTQDSNYARRFVAALYAVEETTEELARAFSDDDVCDAFAAENYLPVDIVGGGPNASIHEAILEEGLHIGCVAFEVVKAANPDRYTPGTAYVEPDLPALEDMLCHVETASAAFSTSFSTNDSLNVAQSLRAQELSRSIAKARGNESTSDTTESKSNKIKPTAETVATIRLIEAGKSTDEIADETGTSAQNVRRIKSQFKNGKYEL